MPICYFCEMRYLLLSLAGLLFFCLPAVAQDTLALVCHGHSHNDYTRNRPLLDALDNGFMSIEVDVFYRKGDIKVAHTSLGIRKKKNLKNLYLEPLRKRVKENGGKVYPNQDREFIMMIDLKDNGPEIMEELNRQLSEYKELFTCYENGEKNEGPVRVVLSGGPVPDLVMQYEPRYMSMDQHIERFDRKAEADVCPRASGKYSWFFSWNGKGAIPDTERQVLNKLVTQAHQYSKKVRFWATPEEEAIWKVHLDAGVDWINVDDLARFRKFYLEYRAGE